jgi:Fur family ferric uptake transcriptional regulator
MTPRQQEARDRLAAAGLRVTAPRLAVLDTLAAEPRHLTVDEVRSAALGQLESVSVQAVYDVLGALTDAGLARRIETPGHPARFEARVGDNHHHFVCRGCGATTDIDCAAGAAPCLTPLGLPADYTVDEAEVTYWGTCPDCSSARP